MSTPPNDPSQPHDPQPGWPPAPDQSGQPQPQPPTYGQPQQPPTFGQPQPPTCGQPQQPPTFGQPQPPYGDAQQQPTYGEPGPGYAPGQYAQPPGATAYGEAPTRSSRGKWVGIGVIVALLLALVGAGAYAVAGKKVLGGGDQPEDVLPAAAIGFVKIDLNPSGGQKIGAVRFFNKIPQVEGDVQEDDDLRRKLWESISKDDQDLQKIDYTADIEPWLGDRLAVSAIPGLPGEKPQPLVVLEVKDQEKARTGINKLLETDSDGGAVAFSGDYAVVGETQAIVDRAVTDGQNASLADDATFADDAERLGEDGISSGWVDLARVRQAISTALPTGGITASQQAQLEKSLTGRISYGLRFDGDDLELMARSTGLANTSDATNGSTGIAALPATSLAAFGLANGGDAVKKTWPQILESLDSQPQVRDQLRQAETRLGISLPDDLAVLLGESFAVGLDERDLQTAPRFGARVKTDGARFEQVLGKVLSAANQSLAGLGAATQRTSDGVVVARPGDYAAELAAQGDLGNEADFKAALPDGDSAYFAAYFDVDGFGQQMAGSSGWDAEDAELFAAFDSVGMSARVVSEGEAEFRVRVITK